MNILKIFKGILYAIACILISIPILYWNYPKPYISRVNIESEYYGVDPLLLFAMMKVESGFDENAISRSGAKGLLQIMDKTGSWGAQECGISNYTTDDLFEPDTNIKIGAWYMAHLIKQYNGDINIALMAYNAGSGNVAKWRNNKKYSVDGINLHSIPFKETENYIKKVNFHYKVYQWLY